MRRGEHQVTPTVSEVVNRAVTLCYDSGADEALDDFLRRFEDRDEPVTALGEREREFFEQAGTLEGQAPEPSLIIAAAVATYLAFRRDELAEDEEELLRLAVRAEFGEHPPDEVAGWLTERGIAT